MVSTLLASVAGTIVWSGGPSGLLYAGLLGAVMAPGLPLGWRLFGRSNPAGWLAGAVLGYGLSTLAFWVPIRLGLAHPAAFGVAWLVLASSTWHLIRWRNGPVVALPAWNRRAWLSLLLVLHLVPLLLAQPFASLGAADSHGARHYRAYFIADFFWHLTVLNEVRHFDPTPRDPFLTGKPLHYYWAYFVVPAVLSGPTAQEHVSAETALKVNAIVLAIVLLGLIYMSAWAASGLTWGAACATVLVLLATSFEGTLTLIDLVRRGRPLDALRDINIDAVTAWRYQGLRIDNLVRTMWYTPQHGASISLGLVALLAQYREQTPKPALYWLAGAALALSVSFNPFLGAAFCLVYGIAVLSDVVSGRLPLRTLLAQAGVVLPVVCALVWCVSNNMHAPPGSQIAFGPVRGTQNWGLSLFLSFGGLIAPAVFVLLPGRGTTWRRLVPAASALTLALLLMHFVSLSDRSWVGFRAGNLLLATAPILVACGLGVMVAVWGRGWAGLVFGACLIAGLPTTAIDWYNAQDIRNLRQGPGFPWTIVHTPAQQNGLRWLRLNTEHEVIVQADAVVRDRNNWCIIPAFAGRRMAAGLPMALLPDPDYERLSMEVHEMLRRGPDEVHRGARQLGVDYLWIDQDDGPQGEALLQAARQRPDLFFIPYQRGGAAVIGLLLTVPDER